MKKKNVTELTNNAILFCVPSPLYSHVLSAVKLNKIYMNTCKVIGN